MLESTQLLDGTQLLGDDGAGAGPAVVDVGMAKYQIVVGDNKIGRDSKCEVFITNLSLSRSHAVVEANRDGYTVHDVRSSNGGQWSHPQEVHDNMAKLYQETKEEHMKNITRWLAGGMI